jgi:hypothetical protein
MDKKVQGFPTTTGTIVSVRPVDIKLSLDMLKQGVKRKLVDEGLPLAPPTYTTTTAAGKTETHDHDETTLIVEGDEAATLANQAAWATYQMALRSVSNAENEAIMRYLLLEGVVCDDPPAEWVKRCTFYNMALPEDPLERKLTYIEMVVLPTPTDLERAISAVMAISATGNDQAVQSAEASFRRAMEGKADPLDLTAGG